MADIERLPCGVEHELRADAAIIRSWIDVANGPINREALADRLDRYANAAAELTAEIEGLRAEVEGLHEQLRLATVDQVNAEAEANDARSENERLAEALRELVEVFSESGMYDEEVFAKARAALAKEADRG